MGVFFCGAIGACYHFGMPSPTEQWFLDLDGVRSGPYQTSEVLSLVAEGEVLPHHRISTALKDQNWITILDWRLEQARLRDKPRPPTEEIKVEHTPPAPRTTIVNSEPPPKRDPTAEMFDLLQNTKTKREIKSQQEAIQIAEKDSKPPPPILDFKTVKFIGFLVMVTLGGFFLGQLFRNNSHVASLEPKAPTPSATPLPSPIATETPVESPATEVIEKSDDKITIRAKVPVQDKETQEMKDLKKELQEIKALKEELKKSKQNKPQDENAESVDENTQAPALEEPTPSPNPYYPNYNGQ